MISTTLQKAINEQINKELYSSYLYLAMSAHFETKNLPGFAAWMRVQSQEEYEHAMKFYGHLVDRGGKVELKGIDTPKTDWKSPLEIVKQVQEHEGFVTASINSIFDIAVAEKDYPAQGMLQWFVNEQVEEEKNAGELVHLVTAMGGSDSSLILLDVQLGKRKAD
jgi:ferritin